MEERFEKGRVYKLVWVTQKDGMMIGESQSRRMEETRRKEERFQKEEQLLHDWTKWSCLVHFLPTSGN
jgi:hypothetical protein